MEYGALIFVHVLAGVLWASGAFFFGFFVLPAAVEAGPAGGAVIGGLMKRKFPIWMTGLATLAVFSGLRLWVMAFMSKGGVAWLQRPEGIVLTLAGLGALHAYVVGLAVQRPTAMKLGALGAQLAQAQGKPDAALLEQFKATQVKLSKVARKTGAELLGVMALMALRYLLLQI